MAEEHRERERDSAGASFGVELEYFLLDTELRPQLGSGPEVVRAARDLGLTVSPELGSFQIELNPGPWPLTPRGIGEGISELERSEAALDRLAATSGLVLSRSALCPVVDDAILSSAGFFTDNDRYASSRAYFAERAAEIRFEDGSSMHLPGESAVACLNEIHVHVQLANDRQTMDLFNILNGGAEGFAKRFVGRHAINQKRLARECTTMSLFAEANGEWVADGASRLRRVGFLPGIVETYRDYDKLVQRFERIPLIGSEGDHLDLESTVYFWVRLRGKEGSLRVEYRPPEMRTDWQSVVRSILQCAQEEQTAGCLKWN